MHPSRLPTSTISAGSKGRSQGDEFQTANKRAEPSKRPPSPLTEKKLEQLPGYRLHRFAAGSPGNSDGNFTHSEIRSMQSIEHPHIASRSSKIKIINEAANIIESMPADKPVTVVSMGSGALLTEHLIHDQLTEERKENVKWRCIDTNYAKSTANAEQFKIAAAARSEFGQDKKDARAFSTADTYLSKTENGQKLVDIDKKGSVLILSIDPPTPLPDSLSGVSEETKEAGFFLVGKIVPKEEIKKANMVLLTLANNTPEEAAALKKYDAVFSDRCNFSNAAVKCYLDKNGELKLDFAGGIPEEIKPFLSKNLSFLMSKSASNKMPIENIYDAVNACAKQINEQPNYPFIALSTLFNEYQRGVDSLIEKVADATGDVSVATLINSQPEVKTIKSAD